MSAQRPIWVSALHDFIAAPLNAVIEADLIAARKFVQYISDYGFEPARADDDAQGANQRATASGQRRPRGFVGDMRMVSFSVDQVDPDGRTRTRMVRIPALSLVPLPLLQVKEADFRFSVRIIEGYVEEKPGQLNLLSRPEDDEPDDYKNVTWRAVLVPESGKGERDDPSLRDAIDANLNVKLSVAQSDIPVGITRMLALMNESAHIGSGAIQLSRRRIELPVGRSETVRITVIDFNGDPVQSSVEIRYPRDSGITLEANDKIWPSGSVIETSDDGTITLELTLDQDSALQRGEQIVIRFATTVDGIEISENLYVLVQ